MMDTLKTWKGKRVVDLPRKDLLEVIEYLSSEVNRLERKLHKRGATDEQEAEFIKIVMAGFPK